jgi:hypothetical protein
MKGRAKDEVRRGAERDMSGGTAETVGCVLAELEEDLRRRKRDYDCRPKRRRGKR